MFRSAGSGLHGFFLLDECPWGQTPWTLAERRATDLEARDRRLVVGDETILRELDEGVKSVLYPLMSRAMISVR